MENRLQMKIEEIMGRRKEGLGNQQVPKKVR